MECQPTSSATAVAKPMRPRQKAKELACVVFTEQASWSPRGGRGCVFPSPAPSPRPWRHLQDVHPEDTDAAEGQYYTKRVQAILGRANTPSRECDQYLSAMQLASSNRRRAGSPLADALLIDTQRVA